MKFVSLHLWRYFWAKIPLNLDYESLNSYQNKNIFLKNQLTLKIISWKSVSHPALPTQFPLPWKTHLSRDASVVEMKKKAKIAKRTIRLEDHEGQMMVLAVCPMKTVVWVFEFILEFLLLFEIFMVFLWMLFCTRDELGTNWSPISGEFGLYKEVFVVVVVVCSLIGLGGEQFQLLLLLLLLIMVLLVIAVVRIITGMRILTHWTPFGTLESLVCREDFLFWLKKYG